MSDGKSLNRVFARKSVSDDVKKRVEIEQCELLKKSDKERCEIMCRKILATSSLKREEIDEDAMMELALNLCTEDGLKRSYLNKDFKAVVEYFRKIQGPDKKNRMLSTSESRSEEKVETIEETEDGLDLISLCRVNQKIKIKLVVAEIAREERDVVVRKLLSPFASVFNLSPRFGMFHTALVIGPWYLEWTDKGFCLPKKCYSQSAIMALDVNSVLETADVDFVINKVSEVVTRWNVMREYNKGANNCQGFIDDILVSLGIDPLTKFSGQLGEYLKSMRLTGESRMMYKLSPDIRDKLELRDTSITFETHEELDQFLVALHEKYPEFLKDHPHDEMLLKSFDRAFWLKHYRNVKIQENAPLSNNGECNCPFLDPKSTRSFGGDDWQMPMKK